jgi:hypothetical protein
MVTDVSEECISSTFRVKYTERSEDGGSIFL